VQIRGARFCGLPSGQSAKVNIIWPRPKLWPPATLIYSKSDLIENQSVRTSASQALRFSIRNGSFWRLWLCSPTQNLGNVGRGDGMALNPFWPSPPSFLFLAFAAGNLWGHYRAAAAATATKLQHEWGCEPAEESVRVGRLCRLLERSRVYNASHTLASLLCTVYCLPRCGSSRHCV